MLMESGEYESSKSTEPFFESQSRENSDLESEDDYKANTRYQIKFQDISLSKKIIKSNFKQNLKVNVNKLDSIRPKSSSVRMKKVSFTNVS